MVDVHVPHVVQRAVPRVETQIIDRQVPRVEIQTVERVVEVPQVQIQDKIVEVPQVQEVIRHVPKIEVQEIVREVTKIEVGGRHRYPSCVMAARAIDRLSGAEPIMRNFVSVQPCLEASNKTR